ncbi:MAG TPA: FkbM family methyltransferase [Accumulibacter sp.]|nr:FkbM family methyltransferase [Accumulibacter sp.]HND80256.1 FkbM family methyltransferase [Accumulibacter sp.]HNE13571.1 FkbM family methyltransferase [Accumulibacter sp.]HNG37797.1 FkbM family methyltransferase [Accumulibacter sp.]HNH24479.1 FkbM family methyltransferase [Accumulibacter sp.]
MRLRQGGKTEKRLKKLLWRWQRPAWAENQGIWLPCCQPGISAGIARQIFFGEYESKEIDIVSQKIADHDIVIEVGAGLGFLSAYCAKRIGSTQIHSFEANPALMPLITATYEKNSVSPAINNILLGRGAGKCDFYVEDDFWASSTSPRSADATVIQVVQQDLNETFYRLSPTFLIVDIEGGEGEFFAYAELSGIKKICLETHPDVLGNEGISQIFSRLFSAGFVLDFSCIRKNVFFFYRP